MTLTQDFNTVESIIAKTMEYLSIPSVVGFEGFFMQFLYKDFQRLRLNVTKYPGLLEVSGSKPNQAIICAHIDRHGLISLGSGEYAYAAQYMKEIKYGEPNLASRKALENIIDRFVGEEVYAYDPRTALKLGKGKIRGTANTFMNGDAIFKIQDMTDPGHDVPIAYAKCAEAEGDHLKGQIDNTIGVATVYALFRAGYQGTAYLTTEEEIGKSWIHIAAHLKRMRIQTENLIVLDTSPYKEEAPLDNGTIVLRNRDRFGSFNKALTKSIMQRCETLNIPYQYKDKYLLDKGAKTTDLGTTELGRLVDHTKKRWNGASFQIPTNQYHTSCETTSKQAIYNFYIALKNMLVDDPLNLEIHA